MTNISSDLVDTPNYFHETYSAFVVYVTTKPLKHIVKSYQKNRFIFLSQKKYSHHFYHEPWLLVYIIILGNKNSGAEVQIYKCD